MAELQRTNGDRVKAMVGVAAFHALVGYAFLTGLASEAAKAVSDNLRVFEVPVVPPAPIEEPVPAKAATPAEEGAAAPPNLNSKASPVVAPPPKVRLEAPPPVVAAPLPTPVPGKDPSAGAAQAPGPGTGSGGVGTGTGSGGEGTGAGGGGGASRAKLLRGRLVNPDYPRAALRAGVQGSVSVSYTVGTDGRASGCRVTRSSGSADLDAVTCRLIERRFRYEPARDAQGKAVPETVTKTYDWLLPLKSAGP